MEFIDELRSLKGQMLFKQTFEVPKGTQNIVIAGMGGSGISARIFEELYSELPIHIVDDYTIPHFVNDKTLFIAISYSGNTEEVLSALDLAKKKNASLIGITSGGTLEKEVEYLIKVPKGIQPRSAVGYMMMPLIRSFNVFPEKDIEEAYQVLEKLDMDNKAEELIAKDIASKEGIPVIYGVSPYKAVSYRWKTQFNENPKILAYSDTFPELNHNDTMALNGTYRKGEFYFLVLSDGKNEKVERRIPITEEITKTQFKRIGVSGKSKFARVMEMVHKGDYITYHLAKNVKKNPTDVSVIEELKKRLAKSDRVVKNKD